MGDSPDFDIASVEVCASQCASIIALDGAALKLPSHVAPTVVCGDFDSASPHAVRAIFPDAECVHLDDQNRNDLEKGLILAIERGASSMILCCCLGGATDKHLAALGVIARYHAVLPIAATHNQMVCRVASRLSPVRFPALVGDTVSTIPWGAPATVSLTGVRYPLAQETLNVGSHGVSNEAVGGEVAVDVMAGEVFVFHQPIHGTFGTSSQA